MKDDFADGGVERWGKNPVDVVEKWINGEYDFQSSQKVPDWMMPDLDNSGSLFVMKYIRNLRVLLRIKKLRSGSEYWSPRIAFSCRSNSTALRAGGNSPRAKLPYSLPRGNKAPNDFSVSFHSVSI